MGLRKEDAYQYALCMDLTGDKFQFAVVHPEQKKIVLHESFDVQSFNRDSIEEFLSHEVLKFDFHSYSLSAGSIRNTLIPVDLFSYSKPKDIFKLNYPEPIDNLDYNRIPELGIVNIYEVPLWIKSLFVIRFPRIKIVHRSTVLLKGIFDQASFSPKVHLFIEKEKFYFMISEKSKLTYFNHFEFKELADLVYYVHFVFDQKEYDQSKFEINIYGKSTAWEDLKALEGFINSEIKIADSSEKGENFILAKQTLCV
ncbi:DUF3822 family protein [Crocinitomix sp.]|nr:DUF3822 family protein [Crocinitomix sp.]